MSALHDFFLLIFQQIGLLFFSCCRHRLSRTYCRSSRVLPWATSTCHRSDLSHTQYIFWRQPRCQDDQGHWLRRSARTRQLMHRDTFVVMISPLRAGSQIMRFSRWISFRRLPAVAADSLRYRLFHNLRGSNTHGKEGGSRDLEGNHYFYLSWERE